MLIDSGSDWNVISESDWKLLRNAGRDGEVAVYGVKENPGDCAKAYGSAAPLVALRCFHAWVEVPNSEKPKNFAKFYVVKGGSKSLLGRETAIRMQLLQLGVEVEAPQQINAVEQEIETESSKTMEAVEEFPCIPNFTLDFDIDAEVAPSVKAYVNIPEAYRDKATERLKKMEAQGFIEKVTSAPRWISGLSAVPKGNDDFRLVVNMVGPNRAIRRRFYKMPTMEHIRTKLSGAKYFTKLDLTSAFHHVKLGEKSKEMTTFLGPDGMYRFRRLNFGVSSAPEAFQQKMDEIIGLIPNTVVYVDDILVFANNLATLRVYTKMVHGVLKANNLTLNERKCEYEKESLEFLGHELSAEGFNISKKKVESVERFRTPQNSVELKSFLGLASFVSTYIKDFAGKAEPLWRATGVGQFQWGAEQEESFQKIKEAIVSCTVRQGFFSSTDETFLYTDASPVALGAVLVQKNTEGVFRAIAFASKLLSPTERRYPQTQREALGIVWGAEHFWYFLVGRKFTIRTDAEGIAFILKSDHTQTKRIMRRSDAWALRMEAFDYSVEYVKGEDNIADSPSRLVEGIGSESFEDGPTPGEIMTIALDEPADIVFAKGRVTLEEVRWHASQDATIAAVIKAVGADKWPRALGKFKSVKHELRVRDGLLTKMGSTVIPEKLRPKVLATAHAGHPGVVAMKSILRQSVWWPEMLAHSERWVLACEACSLMGKRSPPMPMQRSALPSAVWEHIAMDFNGPYRQFNDVYILLVVDSYSRFLFVFPVRSTDFGSSRAVLSDLFDTNGNVVSVKTDHGPPFFGNEYKEFMNHRGIEIRFSTPLDAQQNGGVETYMRLVNKGMTAPSVDGGNWRNSLADTIAAHNAAVCPTTGVAPEVLMFGRKIRRYLPMVSADPPPIDKAEIKQRDWTHKMKIKKSEDARRSARFSNIKVGDKVFVSRPNKLKGQTNFDPTRFTVLSKNHGTLQLLSPLGNVMSRTVTFVKKAPENCVTEQLEQQKRDSPDVPLSVEETVAQDKIDQAENLRRSTRAKKTTANLKDYIYLLGW